MGVANAVVPAADLVGFDLESGVPCSSPDSSHARLSVSSFGVQLGNLAFGKPVDGLQFVDRDGTNGGKYSKVSFGHRPW